MKLKILAIESTTKAVQVEDRKPDKRFTSGYRKLGTYSPKLSMDTTLIVSCDHHLRFGLIVLVTDFGKMKVVDINKREEVRLRNIEQTLVSDYKLNFKTDDYIDALPLAFTIGESSTKQL